MIAETNVNSYLGAAEILGHVREIYISLDQAPQWQEYLRELTETHRRKRKLMPLLKALVHE